jgi:hypothetical protein
VEGNYEKVDRLLDIREGVEIRLRVVEKEIDDEKKVHIIDLSPTFRANVSFL